MLIMLSLYRKLWKIIVILQLICTRNKYFG